MLYPKHTGAELEPGQNKQLEALGSWMLTALPLGGGTPQQYLPLPLQALLPVVNIQKHLLPPQPPATAAAAQCSTARALHTLPVAAALCACTYVRAHVCTHKHATPSKIFFFMSPSYKFQLLPIEIFFVSLRV